MKISKYLRQACAFSALLACTGPARQPNLVVITVDTLRADSLGVYGNPDGHTPFIDAFAAGAVVFENALTAIGTTIPSHATLFTGLYPKHHGVRWNGDALDDGFTTLAELLGDAGYETAAFVSWPSMLRAGGLGQGFVFSDPVKLESGLSAGSGDAVNELAIPWIASLIEQPFFLWLHYFETHSPYRLTPFAREKLAGYRGPLAAGAPTRTFYALGREIPWTPREARALRVLYDGEVREADRLVGQVLDALRRRDLISGTIVVITSDHGQALGEHGQVGHGSLLSQPVLHVPLMVYLPGVAPRRVPARVGLVDLLPFLLELLELPPPPNLDGRSLAPILTGDPLPAQRYFAEVRDPGDRLARIRKKFDDPQVLARVLAKALEREAGSVAVFEDDIKGVLSPEDFRVYDLAKDPQELQPMVPERADSELTALRTVSSSYREGTAIESSGREFTQAVMRELEALGYIQ